MLDGRQGVRGKARGGLTEFDERGLTMDCMGRNSGQRGADIDTCARRPDGSNLNPARKDRSFLGQLVSRQLDRIGLAFRMMTADEPVSDLDERLRRSEIKKRQLQRRIDELLGRR